MAGEAKSITRDDFDDLFEKVKNWGRWGAEDQQGALNYITPAKRAAAAALVKEGLTISCALPMTTRGAMGNPNLIHFMSAAGDLASDDGYGSTRDFFGISPHGRATTHLDALCHILYKGRLYNGVAAEEVTSIGPNLQSIETFQDGVFSRGVLLDIPRVRGVPYLEPGEAIYEEELEAAEAASGTRIQEGDVILVYTGRFKRFAEQGPVAGAAIAGLHATAAPWVHRRNVSLMCCDGISDVVPHGLMGEGPGVRAVHMLAIAGMGMSLVDNLYLETLATACAERNQWHFCFMIAPLRLTGGTASPVNPLAIF